METVNNNSVAFCRDNILPVVCEYIINGGSLLTLCEKQRIMYSTIINWINEDSGRKKLYEQALKARGEYVVEKMLNEAKAIAEINPDDGITEAKYSDKLKAIELVLKDLGRLSNKVEHMGTVTLEDLVERSYVDDIDVEATVK